MSVSDSNKVDVAVLDDYQRVSMKFADWSLIQERINVTIFQDTLHDEDELVSRLSPFQIICAMRERTKFPKSLIDRLPNLRFIGTTGMGNRAIDLEATNSHNIVVSGTGGQGNSTLEHIWALILGTVRYIPLENDKTRQGDRVWQHSIPMGLSGKTLGLVGLGKLGQATAKIARAFGMKVVAWSPHLTRERADAADVGFAESKEELFQAADVISIHMVLSPDTQGLIGILDLLAMKQSAFLINTSRGPIVDEQALIQVLSQNKIAGAGLDVFDIEPLPLDHPLRALSNVTLSPHLGYVSDDNYEAFWKQTVENIEAFLNGNPKRILSNRS